MNGKIYGRKMEAGRWRSQMKENFAEGCGTTKEQRNKGRQKDFETEKWDCIAVIMHKGQ